MRQNYLIVSYYLIIVLLFSRLLLPFFFFLLQCITDTLRARDINISTSLPDDVLDFVRRHPLMSQQIQSSDRRPLLFRRTTDYTHIAALMVQGLDGRIYHVLYMATGVYAFLAVS